jgi:hypothetical protein
MMQCLMGAPDAFILEIQNPNTVSLRAFIVFS